MALILTLSGLLGITLCILSRIRHIDKLLERLLTVMFGIISGGYYEDE